MKKTILSLFAASALMTSCVEPPQDTLMCDMPPQTLQERNPVLAKVSAEFPNVTLTKTPPDYGYYPDFDPAKHLSYSADVNPQWEIEVVLSDNGNHTLDQNDTLVYLLARRWNDTDTTEMADIISQFVLNTTDTGTYTNKDHGGFIYEKKPVLKKAAITAINELDGINKRHAHNWETLLDSTKATYDRYNTLFQQTAPEQPTP